MKRRTEHALSAIPFGWRLEGPGVRQQPEQHAQPEQPERPERPERVEQVDRGAIPADWPIQRGHAAQRGAAARAAPVIPLPVNSGADLSLPLPVAVAHAGTYGWTPPPGSVFEFDQTMRPPAEARERLSRSGPAPAFLKVPDEHMDVPAVIARIRGMDFGERTYLDFFKDCDGFGDMVAGVQNRELINRNRSGGLLRAARDLHGVDPEASQLLALLFLFCGWGPPTELLPGEDTHLGLEQLLPQRWPVALEPWRRLCLKVWKPLRNEVMKQLLAERYDTDGLLGSRDDESEASPAPVPLQPQQGRKGSRGSKGKARSANPERHMVVHVLNEKGPAPQLSFHVVEALKRLRALPLPEDSPLLPLQRCDSFDAMIDLSLTLSPEQAQALLDLARQSHPHDPALAYLLSLLFLANGCAPDERQRSQTPPYQDLLPPHPIAGMQRAMARCVLPWRSPNAPAPELVALVKHRYLLHYVLA